MVEQKLHVNLVTGRTIDQGVGKERGKKSKEYFENASVCFMDEQDMKRLDIKNGKNIQVSTKYGSVVVKALTYKRGSILGMVFIPCGLWANAVCGDQSHGIGMPLFKNIPAEVEPATDKSVLKLEDLLREEFGR